MSFNTPTQLANHIGLQFADFDTGQARFQNALDTANDIILFRFGVFDADTSYAEPLPHRTTKFNAASNLRIKAELKKAGSILYRNKAQIELQFGESGNPISTPDGLVKGAFTPEKNVQASEYLRRAKELEDEFEMIMSEIIPHTNLRFTTASKGRSDFTDDGSYFGTTQWS